MQRLLLLALALFSLVWWVLRALRSVRGRASAVRADRVETAAGGTMVRDRICNTFLPRDRALRLQVGSEEHFFCSDSCRKTFQSRQDR